MAVHLTAHGISLPATQNASGDANTMDDYEEGSFSVAHATIYTTTAYYEKIGREVNIHGEMKTGNISSDTGFSFSAPFNSAAQAGGCFAGHTNRMQWGLLAMTNGTAYILCEAYTALTNNDYYYFSMTYRV